MVVNYLWDGPVARNATPPTMQVYPRCHNSHGFYSKKRRDDVLAHYGQADFTPRRRFAEMDGDPLAGRTYGERINQFCVLGEVELFGHIIEGEDGYRSQGVTIRRLEIGAREPDVIADLERRYACDVVVTPMREPEPSTFGVSLQQFLLRNLVGTPLAYQFQTIDDATPRPAGFLPTVGL